MGIQKDAGELLLFLYNELITNGRSNIATQEILKITNWEGKRLGFAYHYLHDLRILKDGLSMGLIQDAPNFFVFGLYPDAINIIENQPKFKNTFGFEVNLGLIRFSWQKSEA